MKIRQKRKKINKIRKLLSKYNYSEMYIEVASILIPQTTIIGCTDYLIELGILGAYLPDYDIIIIPESTQSYTFTLLHEIGHAYHFKNLNKRYISMGEAFIERFADWFATYMLKQIKDTNSFTLLDQKENYLLSKLKQDCVKNPLISKIRDYIYDYNKLMRS